MTLVELENCDSFHKEIEKYLRDSIKQEVSNIEQNPKYEDFYGLPRAATSAGIEVNNISKKERKTVGEEGGWQCVGTKRVVLYCEERMG